MSTNPVDGSATESGYTRRQAVCVLAVLIAVSVTLNVIILPFTQVAGPLQKSFGIDDVQFSFLLGTFFALPTMATSIGGGWLADRLSRRRLLMCAMVAWTGGAVWTALAPTYEQLAAGRLLVAAAAGIKFPLSMTWISDAFPPQRRAKAVGTLFVVFNIGPAIGASIGGIVLQAAEAGRFAQLPFVGGLESWRAAILLMALSNVFMLPFVAMLRDTRPERALRADGADTGSGRGIQLALVALLIGGATLLSFADSANLAWLPTVLRRQHGFDAQQTGFAFGLVTTVAGLAGSLLGGYAGDWMYKRDGVAGHLRLCSVATLLCAPMMLAYAGAGGAALLAALVASGILSVMAMTVGYVAIQSCLPPERAGFGTGVAHAVTNLAAAFAPTAAALASSQASPGPAALGVGVASVTAASFLAAAVLYAALARRPGRWGAGSRPPDLPAANAPA